jgi:hypothetical protein
MVTGSDDSPINPSLYQPLEDAVELFNALQIPYALIGGIAAMVYGRSRFTEDVDFVAAADHQDVLSSHPEVMRKCRFYPESTWKRYHDSGVEMDICKDEFSDQIASRAVMIEFRGKQIRIAERHDLIAMKLRADRPQDDYDISEMIKNGNVDESVLRQRTTAGQFQHFLEIKKRVGR